MHRREFTLQLYDGKPPPPPIDTPLTRLSSLDVAATAPTWRCSGCLMAWGVYGATTGDARPEGAGCTFCKSEIWMADSPAARMLDSRAGRAPSQLALDSIHAAAPYAIHAAEYAIKQGHYNRLTHSCQDPIKEKVAIGVRETMLQWLRMHGSGQRLDHIQVGFYNADMAVMTVMVSMAYPSSTTRDKFTVRYRWVQ